MPYSRGDYRDKWRIERLAAAVRTKLKIDQLEPLSPWQLADAIPAHIFYPEDFDNDVLAHQLRRVKWDGFAFCCDGDPTLMILLNPARLEKRQRATLMARARETEIRAVARTSDRERNPSDPPLPNPLRGR